MKNLKSFMFVFVALTLIVSAFCVSETYKDKVYIVHGTSGVVAYRDEFGQRMDIKLLQRLDENDYIILGKRADNYTSKDVPGYIFLECAGKKYLLGPFNEGKVKDLIADAEVYDGK